MGGAGEAARIVVTGGAGFIGARLVRRLLERSGLAEIVVIDDFRTAAYSEQALARLLAGGVDVLVTDLDMPRLDGRELLRHLAAIADPPATVVISGYLDAEVEAELASNPAVRLVLRKPFDVVEFAETVGVLARSQRPRSAAVEGSAE